MKRNKKNSDFFSKKRSKYKLTFFNESSLEDVWTICFSRFGAIMTAILLIGLIVVAILSVIVGTPVKNLLPGYLKTEERIEMVDKILRVDSLAAEVQRRDAYIKNLASILTGEIKIDSIGQQADSLLSTTTDTLLPESKLMANYIKQYEQEEKYTLNVFTPTTPIDGKLFYPPLKGKIIKAYNPKEGHSVSTYNAPEIQLFLPYSMARLFPPVIQSITDMSYIYSTAIITCRSINIIRGFLKT